MFLRLWRKIILVKNTILVVFFNRQIPLVATWVTTYLCPLKCPMCYQIRKKSEDLSTEDSKNMIWALQQAGVYFLHLTGGEPLVRKDIIEIIKYAKKDLGMHVSLNTSCTDPHNQIYDVAKELDTLIISFDGMEENHDKNRGKGSFKKNIEVIKEIRKRGLKVNVTTNMCYGDHNKDDVPKLTALAKELNVKIKIYE